MSDDLRDDLKSIDGVGDATADEILAVLDDHDTGTDPYVEKAKGAAAAGNDRQAAVYLRRATGDN